MRIACVFVPSFPLIAQQRLRPELAEGPAVVMDGKGTGAKVIALSPAAAGAGLRQGLSLPQARAMAPRLHARERDADAEGAAQEALLRIAEEFSPKVEDAKPGVAYLDVEGTDERALCGGLARRCRKLGLPARVGVAGGRAAAYLAALESREDEPLVVSPGEERRFLAPLPVGRLQPPAEILEVLELWGIRTLGALAALPEQELAERLGPRVRALHRHARGEDRRPLLVRPRGLHFAEALELDWAVCELEPFLALLEPLMERLGARLKSSGMGCSRLEVGLKLEPDGEDFRAIELAAATDDARTWAGLLRLELSARPPRAPIVGAALAAIAAECRPVQLSLFGSSSQSPSKLSALIARLSALLGARRVGSPAPSGGHRPERFGVGPYAPAEPRFAASAPERAAPRLFAAVRVLRPGVALEVGVEGGVPAAVSSKEPGLEIRGEVLRAAGPWRVEDGWWSAPMERDYWDVELSDGALYRIFEDRRAGGWRADGVYD